MLSLKCKDLSVQTTIFYELDNLILQYFRSYKQIAVANTAAACYLSVNRHWRWMEMWKYMRQYSNTVGAAKLVASLCHSENWESSRPGVHSTNLPPHKYLEREIVINHSDNLMTISQLTFVLVLFLFLDSLKVHLLSC